MLGPDVVVCVPSAVMLLADDVSVMPVFALTLSLCVMTAPADVSVTLPADVKFTTPDELLVSKWFFRAILWPAPVVVSVIVPTPAFIIPVVASVFASVREKLPLLVVNAPRSVMRLAAVHRCRRYARRNRGDARCAAQTRFAAYQRPARF